MRLSRDDYRKIKSLSKEEMDKIAIHRKNLIKEKLALKEAKEQVEKTISPPFFVSLIACVRSLF